jgi:lipase chaperone LimK
LDSWCSKDKPITTYQRTSGKGTTSENFTSYMRFSKNFSELSDQQLKKMLSSKQLHHFMPKTKEKESTVYIFEKEEIKKELTLRTLRAI